MSSLANKYSNWQIYGFFGLFLTNTIWTFYALTFVKVIPYEKNVIGYLYDMMSTFGVYVGIPIVVSFLILYKMNKQQMINKSNYFSLLLVGFKVSIIFVMGNYF